jgi:hypothetical protein
MKPSNYPDSPYDVGDEVLINISCTGTRVGEIATIDSYGKAKHKDGSGGCECGHRNNTYWKKITTNKNMNIKEQFTIAITPEPQKSFRKAGITDGDNLLTEDGMKVYLSWRLQKDALEFKKEIVDPMLEEIKKEK